MRETLYVLLMLGYLPLIWWFLAHRLVIRLPLYAIYFFSCFLLNAVGAAVVVFPELDINSMTDYFTYTFMGLLLAQLLSFYAYLPMQMRVARSRFVDDEGPRSSVPLRMVYYALGASGAIVATYLLFHGLPPVLNADFDGGNNALVEHRTEHFDSTSFIWFYRIGFYYLPQIALVTLVLFALQQRWRIGFHWPLLAAVAVGSALLSLAFMHKTPLVLLLLSLFIGVTIFSREIKVTRLLRYSLVLLAALSCWYWAYFSGYEFGLDEFFDRFAPEVANRIFGAYSLNLAVAVHITQESGFFMGTTAINPRGVLPYEVVNLSRLCHSEIFGIPGDSPPPALGYAYADFGWIGVALYLLLVNLALLLLQSSLNLVRSRVVYASLVAYGCTKLMFLSMSSFAEVVLNPVEVITLGLIVMIVVLGHIPLRRVNSVEPSQ